MIDLLVVDDGDERGVNVRKYDDVSETPLTELIVKAKGVILLINVLEGLGDVSKDIDIFKK